ncbi:peptide/nickel transport system ATP-binding protein [Tamaricihabitans halophyticus]|uniref:Peptide/nickel transport system ATP-binding protein n=1 Tax=Tamaricihabitans halophyticus TaxID=1262583 RepID=A0A4R2QX31_9PSEU|nr:ABC transporter ATP-binding protein [Tamaricihabitans halophyticus]TCP54277.1 peptide/nickel transport system ATP-binding protein [Tamaricihabitans halophyticus]
MDVAQLAGLTVRFTGGPAVDDLSLRIRAGERVGLIGESGSGKSLTGLAIAGLLPDAARSSGSVRISGTEILNQPEKVLAPLRGRHTAVVFQDSAVALNPLTSVRAQLRHPLRRLRGFSRAAAETEAQRLLAEVGLTDPAIARLRPPQLSGGQRQRAGIALALTCQPRLLIADEPTTALDTTVQREILGVLDETLRAQQGQAEQPPGLLFISHDLAVVAQLCDRIAVLRNGKLVEEGPVRQIIQQPAQQHTRELVAAAHALCPSSTPEPVG